MIPSLLHQLSVRAALAGCAVLLAAACAPSAPAIAPAPQAEAETRLEAASWDARSSAVEMAAWARQACSRAADGRDACFERALIGLVQQAGIVRGMEVLDTLAATDPEVARNAHPLAHGLGIAAYRSPEMLAGTFAACPVSQMSGCAHGVIQGYFLDLARQGRSIGTAELDALCAPHGATEFLKFQCAHGMGHGLMAVHGNHLPTALQACDLATESFVRNNCHGGAFMENVVNVTHPHHTAGGHATTQDGANGHDAHAAHATGHGAWKALDPADPLYPCNAVDVRYREACYGMQPSAVMFFNGGDVAATARACGGAGQFAGTCMASLGREITAYAARDHGRTLEMCRRAGEAAGGRGGLWCAMGAVITLVNHAADPGEGMRFCRVLQGEESKHQCYRVVGENIAMIVAGTDARARWCQSAEREFAAACRRAAGVEPAPRDRGR